MEYVMDEAAEEILKDQFVSESVKKSGKLLLELFFSKGNEICPLDLVTGTLTLYHFALHALNGVELEKSIIIKGPITFEAEHLQAFCPGNECPLKSIERRKS